MYKENIFLKIITYGPLLFVPLIVAAILFVFIQTYNENFKVNLQKTEQELFNIEKNSIEKKVNDIANLITYKKSVIQENLKSTVKNRVETALLISENIYQKNKDSKSKIAIQKMIKNAIRPLVWNNGESFIWIVDYQGIFNLAPNYLRHLEGSSILSFKDATGRDIIKEEINISKSKEKSGFLWDTFTKPNDPTKKQFEQIAYVKAFGHYNWYFGSGEYIDTATKITDQELISSIKQIDEINSNENYIFLFNSQGEVLISKGTSDNSGKSIDITSINRVMKKILITLKNKDFSFITYKWLNLNTNKMETKHSYVKKIPNTDWVIGSGFYLSDIEYKLLNKTVNMNKIFTIKSQKILYYSILIMLLSLLITYYISKKLKLCFIQYEKDITTKSDELNALNNTLEEKVKKRTNELKQMKDNFEKLATTDTLTQINNRYSLMNILSTEVNRSHRNNTPLSLIMYDIDFFKKVNDTYGHDNGDNVLILLSNLVKKNLREFDTVGRYGGEEFLIVLPNTNIDNAKLLGERIRQEVEAYLFGEVGSITISLGLVELQPEETIIKLFKRVDNLLYLSKNNGRNQLTC